MKTTRKTLLISHYLCWLSNELWCFEEWQLNENSENNIIFGTKQHVNLHSTFSCLCQHFIIIFARHWRWKVIFWGGNPSGADGPWVPSLPVLPQECSRIPVLAGQSCIHILQALLGYQNQKWRIPRASNTFSSQCPVTSGISLLTSLWVSR